MFFNSSSDNKLNNYWQKATLERPHFANMLELFFLRHTALTHLNLNDEKSYAVAKKFLLSTMKQCEQEHSFKSKEDFIKSVEKRRTPQILVHRCDDNLMAIVSKTKYTMCGVEKELHEISFFEKNEFGGFIYSHQFDLINLHHQHCQSKEFDVNIRQLGDTILHQEAKDILDFSDLHLLEQINILKISLTKTGGAGIAANQCGAIQAPLKIILIGVDYQNPEHVVKAITRYPTTLFPNLKICLQPKIIHISKELDVFPEGCLSAQGKFRAKVIRPKTVTVEYQNMKGEYIEEQFTGSDARAMLHELDHILNGKVYIPITLQGANNGECRI